MKYGLFLGCNVPAIRPDVERAIRLTMPKLGVELVDLEGATCCPAFGTFPSSDEHAYLAVSAWNLSIAEEKGVDVMAECGSCYSVLSEATHKLSEHEEERKKVNELLNKVGKNFEGKVKVRHTVDVLYNEVGTKKISSTITKSLEGMNAVIQYPCHTLFPSKVLGYDDPGRPHMLGDLVEALGAKVQSYSRELRCCGGAGGFSARAHLDAVKYTKKKLDAMKEETNADLMVVACITCLLYLDKTQQELTKDGNEYSIPVFDYNQLLALCMGFDPKEVAGISFIPRDKIFEKLRDLVVVS